VQHNILLIKLLAMWQTYASIWLHYIWSTKNREPLIKASIEHILFDQIREVARAEKIHLDHINRIEDHVHCLVSIDTTFRIFDVPKLFKGNSSHFINEQKLIEEYFEWQDGYAVFSVSPTHLKQVRNYISRQKEHHKRISFEDELSKLKASSRLSLK
jgi:putative transposase